MVWHSKAPERCSFHGWNQPTRASTHVLRDGQSMLVTRMGVAVRRLAKERTAMHVGRAHLPGNQQIRAVNSLPPPPPPSSPSSVALQLASWRAIWTTAGSCVFYGYCSLPSIPPSSPHSPLPPFLPFLPCCPAACGP